MEPVIETDTKEVTRHPADVATIEALTGFIMVRSSIGYTESPGDAFDELEEIRQTLADIYDESKVIMLAYDDSGTTELGIFIQDQNTRTRL